MTKEQEAEGSKVYEWISDIGNTVSGHFTGFSHGISDEK